MLKSIRKYLFAALLPLMLLSLTACSGTQGKYYLYPPEPDAPRIQLLKVFSNELSMKDSAALKMLIGENTGMGLGRAYGVATEKGRILIADAGKSTGDIAIFDLQQQKLERIKSNLQKPIGLHIGQDGTRYISDAALNSVIALSPEHIPVNVYKSAAEKYRPVSSTVAGDKLYVADISSSLIRVFDLNSAEELFNFGQESSMWWPTSIITAPDNKSLIVTETGSRSIRIFDLDGTLLNSFGKVGDQAGNFIRPKATAVDKDGRLYVTDVATQTIQIFNKNHKVLMIINGAVNGMESLLMPAGIAIDYENVEHFQKYAAPGFQIEHLIIVSSQGTPQNMSSKINIYGMGKKQGADYSIYDD